MTDSLESFMYYQRLLNSRDIESHPDNKGNLSWEDCAASMCSEARECAYGYYRKKDWHATINWSGKVGETLVYYFFGDWILKQRNDDGIVDPSYWFKKGLTNWANYLDSCLGWVAVGRHWSLLDRVLEFPTDEVLVDFEGPVARVYYLGLADWWRNRADLSGLENTILTRGAGSKQYHLLADIAILISQRDESLLAKAFPKYVKHFLKQRDHSEQVPMTTTFLLNVAKKDGLSIMLDSDVQKHLFEIPDKCFNDEE